jgi:hypothetical protein
MFFGQGFRDSKQRFLLTVGANPVKPGSILKICISDAEVQKRIGTELFCPPEPERFWTRERPVLFEN